MFGEDPVPPVHNPDVNEREVELRILFLAAATATASMAAIPARAEEVRLAPARPATLALGPNQSRDAVIVLRRGESAEVAVLQQGVDVVVEAYSPSGTLLQSVDSPNGRQGDEPVSLFADEAGRYRIHVKPISPTEPTGQVTIRIAELRNAAQTRRLLAEHRRLREEAATWLRRHDAALPARAEDAAEAPLAPFDALAAEAQVIGLGEATHGSREFNDLRLALVRRLVERHGYRLIALEDSASRWRALAPYVQGEAATRGGPTTGWIGLRSRQALLEWARQWNLAHRGDRVRVIGVDPQDNRPDLEPLGRFVEEAYGETLAAAWGERSAELATADEQSSRFGNSTTSVELRQYMIELAGQLANDEPILRRRFGDARYAAALATAADLAAFTDYNTSSGAVRHSRDWYMALAVMRAIDAEPQRPKAVYWAHNAHVSAATTRWGPTGALLRQAFGCGYRAVAATFRQGGFVAQAGFGDARLVASHVGAAPDETIEGVLATVGPGAHLTAWECGTPDEQLPQWLRTDRPLHWIGGVYSADALPGGPFQPYRLTTAFDAIAYFPSVTAEGQP